MPRYSNINLVAVDARIIPAGSIVRRGEVDGNILVFGNPGFVSDLEDFDDDPLLPIKLPPNTWDYKVWDVEWVRTAVDIVVLDITAFGDGLGRASCGVGYEIDAVGLMDAFQPSDNRDNEFTRMRDLAITRLNELKSVPEYRYRHRTTVDPGRPLDMEAHEVHLVLAYRYTSEIDDYNKECDVWIEYVGEVDLDKIAIKETA